MRTISKYALTLAVTGALALAMASPSEARNGRNAAVIGGFAAGAVVGTAAARAYNNGYYYGPGYGSGYAYGGYAYDSYAYEPGPVYVQPVPTYYGRPYYRGYDNCNSSPASLNYGTAC